MIDFKKIKLVVWDLDDTFWEGTLSEGDVQSVERNLELVKMLSDQGIINAVCSKNDKEPAEARLNEMGVGEYFVFNSIDWTPKGPRIHAMLQEMGLRATNVLFLDDNPVNLGEALHFEPQLMTGGPKEISLLNEWTKAQPASDMEHKRLQQYRVLEQKQTSKKKFANNEDFLFISHTCVTIRKDCLENIDRIHELILRTNQLNYTKLRSTKEELQKVLESNDYDCGYVEVRDDFGDYGTVGFYALRKGDRTFEHFLFSCRTIGQGVEQWVYATLGYPNLKVVGEVVNPVTDAPAPAWINQEKKVGKNDSRGISEGGRILVKGPCDLENALHYLQADDRIDKEFTYVKPGTNETYFAHNHSAHILDLLLSPTQKKEMQDDCAFVDGEMLEGKFFSGQYEWIVLSTFLESDFGVYHKRSNPKLRVVIGGWEKPLHDAQFRFWYQTRNPEQPYYFLTDEQIDCFVKHYEFEGHTTPQGYLSFLDTVLPLLPEKTKLCLILGATKYHEDEVKVRLHRELNEAIKSYSASHPRVRYVELDACVMGRGDYTNQINHFRREVYYRMSQEIVKVLSGEGVVGLKNAAKVFAWLDGFAWWVSRHMKEGGWIKTALRRAYRKAKGMK
ncbi:MAG: HAD-IIIC family phosphatase [Bacteroidales bacterium]|nr:HAD-IIIC family phosphatase [Bacteroidales bacterium]